MTEATVDVRTDEGIMDTRTFRDGAARRPLVILYMDAFGVREALAAMARRLAAAGYVVALLNLFYRSGPFAPFDPASAFKTPAERERIMGLMHALTPAGAIADTRALLEALARDPEIDTSRVGTVGYCMGGGYALTMAGAFPDRVRAAASYHGGRLATEAADSPHRRLPAAHARIYVGYATHDNSFPESQREELERTLTAAGVAHTIERYDGAHGFAVSDHPVFDGSAAARHWETLLRLFRETLGAPAGDATDV